jgi:hypothetical protein
MYDKEHATGSYTKQEPKFAGLPGATVPGQGTASDGHHPPDTDIGQGRHGNVARRGEKVQVAPKVGPPNSDADTRDDCQGARLKQRTLLTVHVHPAHHRVGAWLGAGTHGHVEYARGMGGDQPATLTLLHIV